MYTTYVFRSIELKERIKTPCVECGKIVTRTVTASQTLNPFNVTASGEPKTEYQIRLELPAELAKHIKWQKKHATCKAHGGK